MFYNLIMIQWYNKSLFNWSCSFSDMSMLMMGLLFSCHFFPKKENKSYDQKPYDRQKLPGCNPVWLPIHSHNREKERQKREKERKKKRDTIFMFWRLVRDWNGHQFIVRYEEAHPATSTFTLPNHRPAWRLTSIAVCSESGQNQWEPTRP